MRRIPEKTANPKFYADRELTEQDGQQLSDVIRYAVNSEKTQETGSEDGAPLHRFVSGINCSPATARDEMLAVKKRFGKEDGTVAYHGYQSFAPGEATPELAHEIGVKLATRLWGDRYQVIVATHLDKENHLHNHFVVNTVSFADGIKYHRTKKGLSRDADGFRRALPGIRTVGDRASAARSGQAIRRMACRAGTAPHLAWADPQRH